MKGAFRLYDIDQNGSVSKDEMLQIINAIFALTGRKRDDSAEQRVAKIFNVMDKVFIYTKIYQKKSFS